MSFLGGGPIFEIRPIYNELWVEVFRKENPTIPGGAIVVSLNTTHFNKVIIKITFIAKHRS